MFTKTEDIEKHLESRLEQVESKLKNVDPGLEAPESTSELGTFSWHLQVKETRRAMKNHLIVSRAKIEESLRRLKEGMYGICEDCGKQIEEARLKIMPTTTLCVGCK